MIDSFTVWLKGKGWSICDDVGFVDIVAERAGERMYVEAKGRTVSPGLDVDTMFGQLLRRMPVDEVDAITFAVVVPDIALPFVERVPQRVRDMLRIRAYAVREDGTVVVAESYQPCAIDSIDGLGHL